jgi:hypothetical protein
MAADLLCVEGDEDDGVTVPETLGSDEGRSDFLLKG